MKRQRILEVQDTCESGRHVPDTLLSLAANSITGPAGHHARIFEKTKDLHHLNMAHMYANLQDKTNVTGRVPVPKGICGWYLCPENSRVPKHSSFCASQREIIQRERMHGQELELARLTGKMLGTAVISGEHPSGGVSIRVDSIVYPELWMEIVLSPEQVQEAHSLLRGIHFT
jgi:hypothetical protein